MKDLTNWQLTTEFQPRSVKTRFNAKDLENSKTVDFEVEYLEN